MKLYVVDYNFVTSLVVAKSDEDALKLAEERYYAMGNVSRNNNITRILDTFDISYQHALDFNL